MIKFTAIFTGLLSMLTMWFSDWGLADYERQTSLKEAVYITTHKQEVLSEYHTGVPSDEVFDPNADFAPDFTLYKQPGKDFTVLNLSDVHFSDYEYRRLYSLDGEMIIRRMVAETKPDLILLSGDMVCGDKKENSDWFSIRKLTDIMESMGVYWAPVFGNHDDESNCDLNFLGDIMTRSPRCLFKKGDPRMGNGNYTIAVNEKTEDGSEKTVECLIMMDSGHSTPNHTQIEWFTWVANGVNALTDEKAELSVYMHIPLPEYQLAYDAFCGKNGKWAKGCNGYGELHEKICCPRDQNGNAVPGKFFEAVKNAKTAKYVFCGHDHMNDFSVEYEGVRLTYMMKLGRGSGYQFGFNGGTVITVGDEGIKNITHKTVTYGITVDLVSIDTKAR